MTKYESDYVGGANWHIGLKEDTTGILKFMLISPSRDLLYYQHDENQRSYDVFGISIFPPVIHSQMCKGFEYFSRLHQFEDSNLEQLSQITNIPLEELVEMRDIEKEMKAEISTETLKLGSYKRHLE
jgi:hypothetical protein